MSQHVREVAGKLARSIRFRKLLLLLLVLMFVLGLVIVPVESGVLSAKILDYEDGLWFAITTVTGVGYGDMYPVTLLGRLIAVILEVGGVVLFGSLVAFVSVEILRYQEDFNMRRLLERQDELHMKLDELKKHLDYLVRK
ncbi:MAG: two pore domain potassium channel family protein [Candidatus Moraniibacteriota bacterium]|nr:MAG: two pore domain potassium channel family protein [Candidatus Moranbacteria bacterium]